MEKRIPCVEGLSSVHSLPFFLLIAPSASLVHVLTQLLILFLIVLYTSLVGPEEALVSSGALVLLVFLDLWGEWKAHKAFAAVRAGVPHQALVLRDNVATSVDRSLLVPGDIVLLRAGMVSGDCAGEEHAPG